MKNLLAKSKVLEDLMSMMDEDMLKKLKSGEADVKVTKIVAKPEGEKEDIMDFLREEGDETPMGEEETEEDYSELEPIRKRVQAGAMSEPEDEDEEMPEGFEEDEDKDFLSKLKSRFKG